MPDFRGRSADQILAEKYTGHASWHVHATLSWLDYVERKQAPVALHYAGLHLRFAVENLWFQIFWAARGATLSEPEFEKALSNTTKLYKLIDSLAPDYRKFAEFDQIIASLDSQAHPPTVVWNIDRLKRIHGECGNLLLHFQGPPSTGYLADGWIADRSSFLRESAKWMWDILTSRGNLVVYYPEGLKSDVLSVWERFRTGEIDAETARLGLKIIQPVVSKKRHA